MIKRLKEVTPRIAFDNRAIALVNPGVRDHLIRNSHAADIHSWLSLPDPAANTKQNLALAEVMRMLALPRLFKVSKQLKIKGRDLDLFPDNLVVVVGACSKGEPHFRRSFGGYRYDSLVLLQV